MAVNLDEYDQVSQVSSTVSSLVAAALERFSAIDLNVSITSKNFEIFSHGKSCIFCRLWLQSATLENMSKMAEILT